LGEGVVRSVLERERDLAVQDGVRRARGMLIDDGGVRVGTVLAHAHIFELIYVSASAHVGGTGMCVQLAADHARARGSEYMDDADLQHAMHTHRTILVYNALYAASPTGAHT
jgi:hypothetical protein